MEISVKNYRNILPKEIIQKAEKVKVRECDELEKGHFQAYLDDGETSFDVTIIINSKGEVTGHLCDCKSRVAFCRHKTALLLFVAKDMKVKGRIKGSKSISQVETLLEDADPERLKAWIRELLSRNQDLSLAFIHLVFQVAIVSLGSSKTIGKVRHFGAFTFHFSFYFRKL